MMWMITYRDIREFFDQVVQIINYPARNIGRVSLLLISLLSSGCNHWPDSAERVLSTSDRHREIPETVNHDYIESLLSIAYARADILINKGAEYCLPGQVDVVHKYLKRSKHEIDGNLLLDAQYHIALAMEQLEYILDMMNSLQENSECLSEFSEQYENDQYRLNFINNLSKILNCDCEQVSSSGSITKDFLKRLKLITNTLNKHHELNLNVYSVNSEQLDFLSTFFRRQGIDDSRLTFRWASDFLPDGVDLSRDGLYFEVLLSKQKKIIHIRKWRDAINIKSAIEGRSDVE